MFTVSQNSSLQSSRYILLQINLILLLNNKNCTVFLNYLFNLTAMIDDKISTLLHSIVRHYHLQFPLQLAIQLVVQNVKYQGLFFCSSLLRIGIIFTDYLYIYLTNSVRHLLFDGPNIVYNKIPTLMMSDPPTLISGLEILVIVDVTINFTTINHATCDMC